MVIIMFGSHLLIVEDLSFIKNSCSGQNMNQGFSAFSLEQIFIKKRERKFFSNFNKATKYFEELD